MPSTQAAKLRARLEAIPKVVREAVKPTLNQVGAHLAKAIADASPKETDALAESVTSTPKVGQDNAVIVKAGNDVAPYARFVEFGTVHAPAHPFFWPTYRAMEDQVKATIKSAVTAAVRTEFDHG